MTAVCPVCRCGEVERRRSVKVTEFMERLTGLENGSQELGRLVSATEAEIGTDAYALLSCGSCGLEFADPMKQPSGRWYATVYGGYRPNVYRERWEFDAVARLVEGGQRLLELGCGDGRFLERAALGGAEVVGVDPNPQALREARRRGLTVFATADEVQGEFDWVCMFHTLEHLPDPRGSLRHALASCRVGGRVAISVPSRRSYIEFIWGQSVLSLPPHHMTSWSEEALRYLLGSMSLIEEQLVCEPLPHKLFRRRYAESLARRGALAPLAALPRGKRLAASMAKLLHRSRMKEAAGRLTGKSMLAIYARPASAGEASAASTA